MAKPKTPRKPPTHFIRAWRKHRGYTLERLSEMIGMTHQNLGKIERGLVPYNEKLLEHLAEALSCSVPDLIRVDPTLGEDSIWSIYDTLSPVQRKQAVAMLKVISGGKTGTDD